ncbi:MULTISPECIES: GtrA family protein [Caproicibacterium]|uniref:GtrA family protein n=1 Tax=Caproicibacterium argilliputei TaxID=3030016 RepID=A0AA97H223_9FIRM|nr:GtrA family protein [Caproicibacterium argilliputei]WOC33136.1 GtrA family protein [Caproicibacterium argilliputei]
MKEKCKALWTYCTSKEMILYIVFGALTTGLNLAVYFLLTEALRMDVNLAYFLAWVVGMLFAFVTNKKYVFESKTKTWTAVLYELGTFTGGRVLTLVIGEILIKVFVKTLGQSNVLWKLISNVVEIVLNWMVSKLITFRKKAD